MTDEPHLRPFAVRRFATAIFGHDRRLLLPQLIFLAMLAAAFSALILMIAANLRRLHVGTGFGFLDQPAGFDISQTILPYDEKSTIGRALLVSLVNTLVLSFVSIIFATIIGVAVGLIRLSSNPMARGLAKTYVETIRNVPLLLQLLFWYFAVLRQLPEPRSSFHLGSFLFLNSRGLYLTAPVFNAPGWWLLIGLGLALPWGVIASLLRRRGRRVPVWSGVCAVLATAVGLAISNGLRVGIDAPALRGFNIRGGMEIPPEFMALFAGLALYSGSYIAENVRAGILSVGKGQFEAARSLGLRPGWIYRLVVLPQALRAMIPGVTNQYVDLIKNSSLGAAIAYPDLMLVFGGTVLNQTGQALEVMIITNAVYLSISLGVAYLMGLYNRTSELKER